MIICGKVAVGFFFCDKKNGYWKDTPLNETQGEFVFIRKEAAKHFNFKKIKQTYILEN